MALRARAALALLAALALPGTAAAATDLYYYSTESAGIFVFGGADDTDAGTLFDAMNVGESEDSYGYLVKGISFRFGGEEIFEVNCRKPTNPLNRPGCEIRVHRSMLTMIGESFALIGVNDGSASPQLASMFHESPNEPGLIFRSSDLRLTLWKTRDFTGAVVSFTIQYRE